MSVVSSVTSSLVSSLVSSVSTSVLGNVSGGNDVIPVPSKTFDWTSFTLDADATNTRSDVYNVKDIDGKWTTIAANEPTWHYVTPTLRGLLLEPTSTNISTTHNYNPTTTAGWTKGGDAAATFTVVPDTFGLISPSEISNLATLGNVYELDNTLGVADAYVDLDNILNTTNKMTLSMYVSGSGTLTRSGGGTPETASFSGLTAFYRAQLRVTPNATSDKLRLKVAAGQKCHFLGVQPETNTFFRPVANNITKIYDEVDVATSPIVTAGSAVTRNFNSHIVSNINAKSWFNPNGHTIVMTFVSLGFGNTSGMHVVNLNAGSSANQFAIEITGAGGAYDGANQYFMRPRVSGGGTGDAGQNTLIVNRPYVDDISRVAFSSSPSTYVVSGYALISDDFDKTFTNRPSSPTTLRFGCNAAGSSNQLFGVLLSCEIYDVALTAAQMGKPLIPSDAIIYKRDFQSLAQGTDYSYTDEDDIQPIHHDWGSLKIREILKDEYPDREVIIMNGNIGATGLLKDQYGEDFGYVFDDGGEKNKFVDWGNVGRKNVKVFGQIRASGSTDLINVTQGGQGGLGDDPGVSQAQYEAGLMTYWNKAVEIVGFEFPMIHEPLAENPVDKNTQDLRNALQNLDADVTKPFIKMSHEIVDLELLADRTHLTLVSNFLLAERSAKVALKELGNTVTDGVYGPSVDYATYAANVVTVTIDHEDGTDFTPSTGIKGLWVFDDGVMVFDGDTDSGVKTSSNTLTLTLPSTPTGVVTLITNYGTCEVSDKTLFVRDNTTNKLVLRSGVYTVTPDPRVSLQQAGIANVVAEWDATLLASYPGTGTSWKNIASTPADGSAQSAYDLTLSGLTFTGTANDPAAYFLSAGLGSAVIGSNTPFLRDLHKTAGGSNYGMILFFETPTTPSTSPILSTHTTSSQNGIEIALDTGVRHRQGYGSGNVSDTGGTISTNTLIALCIGHDHAVNQSYRAINTRTGTTSAHTFSATTTDANQPLTIFARTPSVAQMPTGSKLKSAVLLNTYPTNAIVSAILDIKNIVHNNVYA